MATSGNASPNDTDNAPPPPASETNESSTNNVNSAGSSPENKNNFLFRYPFVHWLFGYIIPLYVIIGSICLIAIPTEHLKNSLSSKPIPIQQSAPNPNLTNINPNTTTSVAPAALTSNDLKTIEIVKLAVDSAKERIESIKETYDKLFSLIAALAALLVFFGFKGLESFNTARTKATETVTRAEEAVEKASAARTLAEQSIKSLENFVENRYAKDNTAEINVSQGLVLKELAELYKDIITKNNLNSSDYLIKYNSYLKLSLHYIDRVVYNPEGIDKKLVSRALIIKGNILKLLGKVDDALVCVELAHNKYNKDDYSSLYNAACYCCVLAKAANIANNSKAAMQFESSALNYLQRAIEMNKETIVNAQTDDDFCHFKDNNNSIFRSMLGM